MTRLLAAILALIPAMATAQNRTQSCAEREIVAHRLFSNYGETLNVAGLDTEQSLIEVWASTESGSWTILSTKPNGISCVLASGTFFIVVPAPIPGEDG